jgi:hypothetical protein
MFQLYLVNHTRDEYTEMCKSNYSQERVIFCLPFEWDTTDEMEIMTQYIFREKLKRRSKFTLVDMYFNGEDSDKESNSDQEDLKEEVRKDIISLKKTPILKETALEKDDEEEVNED